MPDRAERIRRALAQFDFERLFIEELGWDYPSSEVPLDVEIDVEIYSLAPVAQKRDFQVFVCAHRRGGELPRYAHRKRIERRVAKTAYEHLIVYVDEDRTTQVWQWARQEPGRPVAYREQRYDRTQSGYALAQRIEGLAFSLEEEDRLNIVDISGRVRATFNVEPLTRRFYTAFKDKHGAFLNFIEGISGRGNQEWYASIMLNRLMFVYFIQKKRFLDDDPDYLRNRLERIQERQGEDNFLGFYRHFLLRLFHEGLAKEPKHRTSEVDELIGNIPYLNGGLFEVHELERDYPDIHIPDRAFEDIFDFFDGYSWHLDERPLRDDHEINPDVLGYIFEKYINQKQMGAYYTKEDVTGYISENTIIPYLFDAAEEECAIAFETDSAMWNLLTEDPDRYIYDAVKKGVIEDGEHVPLPDEIQTGVIDVSKRGGWNRLADDRYALPTETWREHVARRQRCEDLRRKLGSGEVTSIDDFVTLNLDIRQFAQDAIENSEGPELLRAFYKAIQYVSVLDPTCGSGAFLFAVLNILEPLYEACLERMQRFVEEDPTGRGYADFRAILDDMKGHPNRRYFVLKAIIVRNLYGVDIMEEAVEIARLRLFLKLMAQLESKDQIEPLPDIDFNLRAGNTLVGFASMDQVRKTLEKKFDFGGSAEKIDASAKSVDAAFQRFRWMQMDETADSEDLHEAKAELRHRLGNLNDELDRYLAAEYSIEPDDEDAFEGWRESHQPFHWLVEFYGIMQGGGFDVIVGNPPYLELRQVDYTPLHFASLDSGAIHSMCMERSSGLLHPDGWMSMIVPLALVSTQRMKVVQEILEDGRSAWYANFAWRPGKLFDTVNRALTIFVVGPRAQNHTLSTEYRKWNSDTRELLIPTVSYIQVPTHRDAFWVPKLGHDLEKRLLEKVANVATTTASFFGRGSSRIYYRTDGGLYWKVFTDFPPAFNVNGVEGHSSRETSVSISGGEDETRALISLLSSNLYWWWYTVTSNLRHLNPYDVQNFPIPHDAVRDSRLATLGAQYLEDLQRNSTMLVRNQKQTGRTETQSFKIQESKAIINEIDKALAEHYGFTDEELDFIINYDIKYRIGPEAAD